MKKPKVSDAWLTDADHIYKKIVGDIIEGLEDNPDFRNPVPTLDAIKAQYNRYSLYVLEPGEYTTDTSTARIRERGLLTNMLRQLLPWIQLTSGNDLGKLLTTKVPLLLMPTAAPTPEIPTITQIGYYDNPVILQVRFGLQSHAQLYYLTITEPGTTNSWSGVSRSATITIKGLPRGKKLLLEASMSNINGPSEPTASIPFIIPETGVAVAKLIKPKKTVAGN